MNYATLRFGFTDDYATYSNCQKKKAMKQYVCAITGKLIHKGEIYKELCCWNPYRGKHYRFKLHLSVTRDDVNKLRHDPEHSELYKIIQKQLGFFND